jgi:hypothetical protein
MVEGRTHVNTFRINLLAVTKSLHTQSLFLVVGTLALQTITSPTSTKQKLQQKQKQEL